MSTALKRYYELLQQVVDELTEEETKIVKAVIALQDTIRLDEKDSLLPFMLGWGMQEIMIKHGLFTHDERLQLFERIAGTKIYTEEESAKAFIAIRRLLLEQNVPWNELRITDVIYQAYKADDDSESPPFTAFICLSPQASELGDTHNV